MSKHPVIYVNLKGRIGNQLFQYAMAKHLQRQYKEFFNQDACIVLCDYEVLSLNWLNSLQYYSLSDVKYVHKHISIRHPLMALKRKIVTSFYQKYNDRYMESLSQIFEDEKRTQSWFNKHGIITCENGLINYQLYNGKSIYLNGYFQSEDYFNDVKDDLLYNDFSVEQFEGELERYSNLKKIKNSNTVCISIKVEHNSGNCIYDVCNHGYWQRAFDYIIRHVENPYFMICSDNVDYVLKELIDVNKYDYCVQDKNAPVHVSLAAMSLCKHFIIGNTSFGWWAQEMSVNKDKIVCVPSKWLNIQAPVDCIYQKHMIKIEV